MLELLDNSNNIILTCHKSPDGDALGACLGMADFIRNYLQKSCTIAVPDAFPDFLKWMPGQEQIIRYDKHKEEIDKQFAEADLVFSLDYDSPGRVGDMEATFRAYKEHKVLIDHHSDPQANYDVVCHHEDASSTCELVFRILYQLYGLENLSKVSCICLYTGMMTDTGCFAYNSNSSEIYLIISMMLSKKIDKDKIYRNVFYNYSSWAVRLRGYVMYQKLNVFDDLHACYYSLTKDEMQRFHFIKGDAEGLVNVPLAIKGMKLSISLREDDRRENVIWVSIRTIGNFSAKEVAQQFFNGGGHFNASGGHLDCSMDEAVQITRTAIKHFANELKGN